MLGRINRLSFDRAHRIVSVDAAPEWWPHESGLLGLQAAVKTDGEVGLIDLCVAATNDDPVYAFINDDTHLMDAAVTEDELAYAVPEALRERAEVMRLLRIGEHPPFLGMRWQWGSREWLNPN